MDIRTEDYEKMGAFYLGREYDLKKSELTDDLVLYDSKDLVTHGVVLGMTGSGKTGLCVGLLEEAAMDNIPAIVIDPKGDIANLLLTFPDLAPSDFRPWINEDDASKKGISPDEHAANQAALWEKGLGEWGQSKERIKQFRDKVDLTVFTPGSNAGMPVSILSSLDAPEFEIIDDGELFADRIESTVSSILSLIGVDADPIQDPEHILLSNIFSHHWRAEQNVTLEVLIRSIQQPPFDKIGIMDLNSVVPEKSRFALAMKLNNLLASPGFQTWLEGEALDIKRMLHTPEGKPRISIFSIAHLDDSERMFFVSLLLNQMLGWMRSQSGTNSLRALLYMDEIYGYLPPTAMPPSKKPMMTILKQGRAFGLGALLATQNPVDLDYKALSNIGTWFLGRLQTERDKMRVLDGLEGAAAEGDARFDRGAMEELLAGLGSRVFLLNNVHNDGPFTFHVRWVMSYLRGPLARRQIKQLMDPVRAEKSAMATKSTAAAPVSGAPAQSLAAAPAPKPAPAPRPNLPKEADEFFIRPQGSADGDNVIYRPCVLKAAEVRYFDAKKGLDGNRVLTRLNPIDLDQGEIDLRTENELPEGITLRDLDRDPLPGASFAQLPNSAMKSTTYTSLKKEIIDWAYQNDFVSLYRSPMTEEHSNMGESEADFRGRLVHSAREIRDEKVDELREKYQKKIEKIEDSIQRAKDYVSDQKAQASSAKLDAAMRVGGSILGALLGGRRSRSSSMTGASRAWKESRDVSRAEDKVDRLLEDLRDLEREAEDEIRELEELLDPANEKLELVRISPYKKNCSVKAVGILWMPFKEQSRPQMGAAW